MSSSTRAEAPTVPAWPAGYGLHRLAETDSTNAEAARCAGKVAGPVWIVAERQTAGRGRRGRPWITPDGALAATLLLYPDEPPARAALRSFVAALGLDQAFRSLGVAKADIALKWPNDVLLRDRKVAGILLECAGTAQRLDHLAVGIGVNLASSPEAAEVDPGGTQPVGLSLVLGRPVSVDDMLQALAVAYAEWEDLYRSAGFAPIRRAWLARAARLGQTLTARTQQTSLTGTFETVDEAGNLVLRDESKTHVIPAADIFFD